MGCRILYDKDADMAALYCSTTDVAFGPIFYDEGEGADAEAELFLKWLRVDPRSFSDGELQSKYSEWVVAREAYKHELKAESDRQHADDLAEIARLDALSGKAGR